MYDLIVEFSSNPFPLVKLVVKVKKRGGGGKVRLGPKACNIRIWKENIIDTLGRASIEMA